MPELAINTGNSIFETRRANTSPKLTGKLNGQNKAIIRYIVWVENAHSALQVKKIAPLTQLVIESVFESNHANTKKFQLLIQPIAAYADHVPKLKLFENYIYTKTRWHYLKNISFEQCSEAATYIASERAKYLEPISDITRDHQISDPSIIQQLEEAFVRDRLVPLIDRDFSVSASLLKYGIKSDSARDLLEDKTGYLSGKYRVLRGEPWTEAVRKCGIREDSSAANMLKRLAEKVANDEDEITRHPVWTGF